MATTNKPRDGYVIVQHRASKVAFTSSSAYDCPKWIPISEATAYPNADLATAAARKLWTRGSYGAAVVSLNELAGLEMDMGDDETMDIPPVEDPEADDQTDMVAATQGDPDEDIKGTCPECDCDPCECDGVPDEDGAEVDPLADLDADAEIDPLADPELEREVSSVDGEELPPDIARRGGENEESAFLRPEEIKMINRRKGSARSTPGRVAESDVKAVDLKDPAALDASGTMEVGNGEKVAVPANIKKQLADKVKELTATANANNLRDDDTGSKAMTAMHALEQIADDLALGTVEGMKQAQIHMSSYMSIITNLIPADVIKFISRGGKPAALKDLFGAKWEEARKEKE